MGQIVNCPVCYEWVGIEEADAHHERHRRDWRAAETKRTYVEPDDQVLSAPIIKGEKK